MSRPYSIKLTAGARRDLKAIPRDVLDPVDRAIKALGNTPRPLSAVKLSGAGEQCRVRVGDYRVLYEVQDEAILVVVVRVGHRRDVYRRA